MSTNTVFVVMAETKLYESKASPVTWFFTQEEAQAWVDTQGNHKFYWFEVAEVTRE